MIVFYLIGVAIYVGAFVAYMHNHTEDPILWVYRTDRNYTYDKEGKRVWQDNLIFLDEWTGLATTLVLLSVIWPLTVPTILVYRRLNKYFKNKNK